MPLPAAAQSLEAISGPTHGTSGDTLTFVVEARDADGNPQPGVGVLFSYRALDDNPPLNDDTAADDTSDDDDIGITELGTYRTTTDASGWGQTTLILRSDAANSYQILAWRVDDATLTVDFTVTVDVPPPPRSTTTTTMDPLLVPTTFERISGDDQEGLPGTMLAEPFVVEVRDQNGEPLEGVTVTFAAVIGGGAASIAATLTDSDGRAESVLTLGTDPGTNKVQANAEGISQTVIFNAVGTAPPSPPTVDEDEEMPPSTPDPMTDQDTEPPISTPEPPTSLNVDLSLSAGLNLIQIPLKVKAVGGIPAEIESVSDLYAALGGVDTVNWLITHDAQTQTWHIYFGDAERGAIADRVLTEGAGVLVSIKIPVSVHLTGDPLGTDGTSAITLTPGLNLVGIPLSDPRVTRVSDLLALEGLRDNITAIVVTDNGEFKLIGRASDAVDIPVTGGQGFILIVQQRVTVPITGTAWGE